MTPSLTMPRLLPGDHLVAAIEAQKVAIKRTLRKSFRIQFTGLTMIVRKRFARARHYAVAMEHHLRSVHAALHNHFGQEGHIVSREIYTAQRSADFLSGKL